MVDEKRWLDLDVNAMAFGLTIMALGSLLMLRQMGLFGWHLIWRLWPAQFVALGVAQMLRGWREGRLAGVWRI